MSAGKDQFSPTGAASKSGAASEKQFPVSHWQEGIHNVRGSMGLNGPALRTMIVGCVFVVSVCGLISSVSGQTNVDADVVQTGGVHDLSPVAGLVRKILWLFAGIILTVAGILIALRYRTSTSLYKTATDAQWKEDAWEEAGVLVEESEVREACEALEQPAPAAEAVQPAAGEVAPISPQRLYTPASGPAWGESMLDAFLSSCLKANCLGRVWREEAARRNRAQQVSRGLPDPREAELIRKLKARWHEFHVDPEHGIFADHGAGRGRLRVCLIEVTREKHAVTEAALNAGFVIESVGRYLKSSDVVYPGGLGHYHAPGRKELEELPAEQKQRVLPLKSIPDPWQAMIAGEDGPERVR